jgi:UDP-2,3-diacylglucosamine pyrophosphatase LpxH
MSLPFEISSDTALLAFSDIHLGTMQHGQDDINALLSEIEHNFPQKYPHFKCIVFVGDLFDVLFCSYDCILSKIKKYHPLFQTLANLREKGVKIIYATGNHEIPVGEVKYHKYKNLLYQGIKKNLESNFILKKYTCQYVFIKPGKQPIDNAKLLLYEVKTQIKENHQTPYEEIDLGIPINHKGDAVLLHGHQVFKFVTYLCAPTWYMGLKASQEAKHYLCSLLHPDEKPPNDVDAMDKWIEGKLDRIQFKSSIQREDVKMLLVQYYEYMASKYNPREIIPDAIKNSMKMFLETETGFEKVSTVIYGHTHHSSHSYDIEMDEGRSNVQIINCGAWRNLEDSTCAGLSIHGKWTHYK